MQERLAAIVDQWKYCQTIQTEDIDWLIAQLMPCAEGDYSCLEHRRARCAECEQAQTQADGYAGM